jgi:hypothetical protein
MLRKHTIRFDDTSNSSTILPGFVKQQSLRHEKAAIASLAHLSLTRALKHSSPGVGGGFVALLEEIRNYTSAKVGDRSDNKHS